MVMSSAASARTWAKRRSSSYPAIARNGTAYTAGSAMTRSDPECSRCGLSPVSPAPGWLPGRGLTGPVPPPAVPWRHGLHPPRPQRRLGQQDLPRHDELRRVHRAGRRAPDHGPRARAGRQLLRHGEHLRQAAGRGRHRVDHRRLVRGAASGRRDKVVLATKLYGGKGEWPNDRFLSAVNIRQACEASLRRLQTDHIDLYQMHHVDRDTPWEEIWEAMSVLRTQGKVIYVGSSNFAGWHIAQAQEAARRHGAFGLVVRAVAVQPRGAHRRARGAARLPGLRARRAPVEPAARRPAGRDPAPSRSTGPQRRRPGRRGPGRRGASRSRRTRRSAPSSASPPAQVALAWLLHQPAVTAPIVGPRTLEQLDGAIARARDQPRREGARPARRDLPRPRRRRARGLRLVSPSPPHPLASRPPSQPQGPPGPHHDRGGFSSNSAPNPPRSWCP